MAAPTTAPLKSWQFMAAVVDRCAAVNVATGASAAAGALAAAAGGCGGAGAGAAAAAGGRRDATHAIIFAQVAAVLRKAHRMDSQRATNQLFLACQPLFGRSSGFSGFCQLLLRPFRHHVAVAVAVRAPTEHVHVQSTCTCDYNTTVHRYM